MEIDNGGGGPLVHRSVGGGIFLVGSQIALLATYAGSSLGLQCAHAETEPTDGGGFVQAGNASLCIKTAELALPGTKGQLSWECGGGLNAAEQRCRIVANGSNASIFTVRKMA